MILDISKGCLPFKDVDKALYSTPGVCSRSNKDAQDPEAPVFWESKGAGLWNYSSRDCYGGALVLGGLQQRPRSRVRRFITLHH